VGFFGWVFYCQPCLPDRVDAEGVGGAVVAAGGEVAAVGRVNHHRLLVQHLAGRHRHLPRGSGDRGNIIIQYFSRSKTYF
jgi:hypothetical protein